MFISHYNYNAVPVLEAKQSPKGPEKILIRVTDGDYFYVSIEEALSFSSSIRMAALEASSNNEVQCGDHGSDKWPCPTCDKCGVSQCLTPAMAWNGDTGNHTECESE